jgi:hypothetical protein
MEVTCIMAVLATKTSAQEAATVRDSTKDVEDQAAMAEGEAQDRVSRVDAENAVVLASAHEDATSLFQKIALLEGEPTESHRA